MALTNLAQIAMGTTDIVMMGWLGSDTLAAGALGTNLYFIASRPQTPQTVRTRSPLTAIMSRLRGWLWRSFGRRAHQATHGKPDCRGTNDRNERPHTNTVGHHI